MGEEEFTGIIDSSIEDSVPGMSGQKLRLSPASQPQPRAKRKERTSAACLLVLVLSSADSLCSFPAPGPAHKVVLLAFGVSPSYYNGQSTTDLHTGQPGLDN